MIDAAWDEYRGWAARARELQGKLRRWNLAASDRDLLLAACLTDACKLVVRGR